MDDDTSNDVEILEIDSMDEAGNSEETSEDKPLLQLFKHLIGDSKKNTVLTNTQIINILRKECDKDIAYLPPLELEIYLNLVKKYLKDWPQWDVFDRQINELKATQKNVNIDTVREMLDQKYASLIEYLKAMLNRAPPIIEQVAGATIEAEKNKMPREVDEDVYMEIQCSRRQLNELFFRRPLMSTGKYGAQNNIFNVKEDEPDRIMLNRLSLKAILNWWRVVLEINTNQFVYRRETVHSLSHTLVNKKLNEYSEEAKELLTDFQKKDIKVYGRYYHKLANITSSINRILLTCDSNMNYSKSFVETVLEQIIQDFKDLPDPLLTQVLYRRYMSNYSYMRYLFTEVSGGDNLDLNMHDIQLQEIMSPRYTFILNKFDPGDKSVPSGDWIKITCRECAQTFQGQGLENKVIQHFSDMHQNEPDWQCMNCKETIPMSKLAEYRWNHTCIKLRQRDQK